MLPILIDPYTSDYSLANLLSYTSTRGGLAVFTAMLICFIIGPSIINWLRSVQEKGQPIRTDGPETHLLTKKGTPTMGGAMILASMLISTVIWADLRNAYVWIVLFVTSGYGLLGFIDDYMKVSRQDPNGIAGRFKIFGQVGIGLIACTLIYVNAPPELAGKLLFPVFKDWYLALGPVMILFGLFVVVGSSNSVNLTDGLDGLAIVPIMIAAGSFALIAYVVSRPDWSADLALNLIPNTSELAVLCAALVGAGLGFLWFNAPPAQVFMGDTGSLAAGGAIGTIAVITKHELVLAIIGGLFVMEALSVIIQVTSFKLTGRRIFRMAPIHHHFEKMGWQEPTIVIRFWIVAVVLAMIGLATLKIR
ncbi:MAG: phospho-N-acetylmuramoyl-pentapeptide-transferase [Kiloniella sp.]|nr:phospho-N-acetylmuramoyl-pentapeptide-transferase [Kiloniella sp.]